MDANRPGSPATGTAAGADRGSAAPRQEDRRQVGRRGESIAAAHLERRGYEVIARNWRSRAGELDIVALDGDTLVAVEVKTRTGTGFGHPFEAVTRQKLARLRRLALEYARAEAPARAVRLRVDVVGVLLGGADGVVVEHLRGVEP